MVNKKELLIALAAVTPMLIVWVILYIVTGEFTSKESLCLITGTGGAFLTFLLIQVVVYFIEQLNKKKNGKN